MGAARLSGVRAERDREQGTCHGTDNRAVDALRSSAGRARGVASVTTDVTERQLAELHEAACVVCASIS